MESTSDAESVRAYCTYAQRIAIADLLADVDSGTGTNPTALATCAPDYEDALLFWGTTLADFPSAATAWSTDTQHFSGDSEDLARSEALIALVVMYDWGFPQLDLATRRDWRDKIALEAQALDDDFYGTMVASYPNFAIRDLLNGHVIEVGAAIGIAADVLRDELSGTTQLSGWHTDARDLFADVLDALPSDGGDHNGVYYWEYNVEYLLRFIEAERLDGVDVAATYYDATGWFAGTPQYLLRATHPDTRRSLLGDSHDADALGPSAAMARLADEFDDPLAQRLAWQGHNEYTWYSSTAVYERRDVLDLLWFDNTLAPDDDTDLGTEPLHQCFPDRGLVSLRSGWDADAVDLFYRGGGIVGGHDQPDVGSFELWFEGPLVAADGYNETADRTANASTLLIDGYGQHGDGRAIQISPPENEAQAGLTAYVDASGPSWGPTIDLVAFGSDLRPLYRYDSSGDLHDTGYVNVETSGRTIDEVARYGLWVGDHASTNGYGGIAWFDRFRASGGTYEYRWLLQSAEFDDDASGLPLRQTCPVSASGAYYSYTGDDVALSDGAVNCASCSTTLRDLNKDSDTPNYASPGACDGSFLTIASGSRAATVAPAALTQDGELYVDVVEPTNTLFAHPTATDDGGTISGWHLGRAVTGANKSFLTVLRPEDSSTVSTLTLPTCCTNGKKIQLAVKDASSNAYTVSAWFTNPGSTNVSQTILTKLYEVDGVMGAVAHGTTTPSNVYAAVLVQGSLLEYADTVLLKILTGSVPPAADDGNLAVTYGSSEVYASYQGVAAKVYIDYAPVSAWSSSTALDAHVNGGAAISCGASGSCIQSGTHLTIAIGTDHSGRLSIVPHNNAVGTSPSSACAL